MGYKGHHFTWTNNQEGNQRIMERIDRAIVNREWVSIFSTLVVLHTLMIGSDHCPLIVELEPKSNLKGVGQNIKTVVILSEMYGQPIESVKTYQAFTIGLVDAN